MDTSRETWITGIGLLSSLGEVPAETAFCFATGNTARMRNLDCGLIEVGRAA